MTTPVDPDDPRRNPAWNPTQALPEQPAWPAADPTRIGPTPSGPPPSGWGAGPQGQAGAWGQPPPGGQQPWPQGSTAPWGPPGGQQAPWGQQPAWGGYPPPQPPRRSRGTIIALVVVGVLVLAGLGVGAFLLVRSTAGGGGGIVDDPEPPVAELTTVTAGGLSFGVPADWTPDPNPAPTVAGVPAQGVYNGLRYDCDGGTFLRGFAAVVPIGLELPPDLAAEQFAQLAGVAFYQPADGSIADVQVSDARPVDVGGAPGQLVEATITASDDGCLATGGTILILAVPVTPPGGTPGLAMLLVNGDTAGGPADAPPVPDRAVLDAMIASARPVGI